MQSGLRVSPPAKIRCEEPKTGSLRLTLKLSGRREDALPFTFCISAIGAAPDCDYLDNVSVARGNVILCDHGKTQTPEDFGPVPISRTDASCECVDEAGDVQILSGRFSPVLKKSPVTFSAPVPGDESRGSPMGGGSVVLNSGSPACLSAGPGYLQSGLRLAVSLRFDCKRGRRQTLRG